jgi:hypothetical protein
MASGITQENTTMAKTGTKTTPTAIVPETIETPMIVSSSLFAQLTFGDLVIDPKQDARGKFISLLTKQKRLAEHPLSDDDIYEKNEDGTFKRSENGRRVMKEGAKRQRTWWKAAPNGKIHLTVAWADQLIAFPGGKKSIVLDKVSDIPGVIDILISAVRAGDFDVPLQRKSGRGGRKKKEEKKPEAAATEADKAA